MKHSGIEEFTNSVTPHGHNSTITELNRQLGQYDGLEIVQGARQLRGLRRINQKLSVTSLVILIERSNIILPSSQLCSVITLFAVCVLER
jgi:hypothetical protein